MWYACYHNVNAYQTTKLVEVNCQIPNIHFIDMRSKYKM